MYKNIYVLSLFQLLGLLVSYLVIMIQFRQAESTGSCSNVCTLNDTVNGILEIRRV